MNKDHYLELLKKRNIEKFNTYQYDLLPETFLDTDKIPVKCNFHGIFYQKPYTHLYSTGCPICGRIKCDLNRRNSIDVFLKKAKEKFGDRFDYTKTIYSGQDSEMIITCPIHGDIKISPRQHLWLKEGCFDCGREHSLYTGSAKLLERAKENHGDKYDYSKIDYKKFGDTVEIVCPTHGSFWQSLYDHGHKGVGCPKCARDEDRLNLDQFIERAKIIHDDKYDYSKVIYSVNSDKVTITCKKHGDFIQRAASHLAGNKCKECFKEENRLSKEEFVRQARLIHGDKYDYSKTNYIQNKKPVEIICPIHGSFWQKPNSHISRQAGCPTCRESKGEKSVAEILDRYGINYIREYRIQPHRYRFDFFLPDFNIFIEYHGHQHYKPVELFGGQQGFLETRQRDKDKAILIRETGGNLITLPYTFLDEKILEEQLIRRLKRIYSCWLLIDGKIVVFKSVLEVFKHFSLPMKTAIKDIKEILKICAPDVTYLF